MKMGTMDSGASFCSHNLIRRCSTARCTSGPELILLLETSFQDVSGPGQSSAKGSTAPLARPRSRRCVHTLVYSLISLMKKGFKML